MSARSAKFIKVELRKFIKAGNDPDGIEFNPKYILEAIQLLAQIEGLIAGGSPAPKLPLPLEPKSEPSEAVKELIGKL